MSKIIVNTLDKKSRINKNIYGHFSEHLGRCIYEGLYVGEDSSIPNTNGMRNDVVQALRNIQIPVLRWPGGCFADEYHWKDGIGPRESRKKMVNTHWGGVVEDNSFGTHEFLELCKQLGCEPYINGNVGSGTVQEMSEWMEYMTFDGVSPMAQLRAENGRTEPWSVKYFGVGNENWGCGGNMRPEFYADTYRRFQTYVRNYGENKVFKIACGPNVADYNWTEKVMEIAGNYMDALTLHYYTLPTEDWQHKGSATEFDEKCYYETIQKALFMDELVKNHAAIMSRFDPENRVGLIVDEWGAWYDVEPGTNPGFLYQQNTMRDAMIAAATLNIFNSHSDRVIMANIAQTVNVLQSVILTEGEKMVLTPTYYVFEFYKGHQDAVLLPSFAEAESIATEKGDMPNISVSASQKDDGSILLTIANFSADKPYEGECRLEGMQLSSAEGRVLTAAFNAYNDFESQPVVPAALSGVAVDGDMLRFTLPACSVAAITVK